MLVTAYLTRSDLPSDPRTSREREILQLIAEGETTKEIAQRLGLRVKTVESHRIKLMHKLDIHETAQPRPLRHPPGADLFPMSGQT